MKEKSKKHYNTVYRQYSVFLLIIISAALVPISLIDFPGYLSLLLLYGVASLLCFLLPWVTAGQISITFLSNSFIARTAFAKKTKSYQKLAAICIVPEQIYLRGAGFSDNYKYVVKKENKKLKITKIYYYNVCFLTKRFENENSYKTMRETLQNYASVKDYFDKECLVTVRYTFDLLEELFSHGEFTVYLKNSVLNDISTDIQALIKNGKIKTSRNMDKVAILNQ